MGKSKKRNFSKNTDNSGFSLTRTDAVKKITDNVKFRKNKTETENLISLFGITTEELLEAGADYEAIAAIKYMFL